jgi:hypothetical protein
MPAPERQVALECEAALAGFAEAVPPGFDAEFALLASRLVGDAVRLALGVPERLGRGWREMRQADARVVAHKLAAEVEGVELPPAGAHGEEASETLSHAVLCRDRVESSRVALLRWCAAAGVAPGSLAGMLELREGLAALDAKLSERMTPHRAAVLLGDRVWGLARHDWTAALQGPPEDAEDLGAGEPGPEPAAGPLPRGAWPPDDVVAEYLGRGAWARWVEGAAWQTADFRARLVSLVEGWLEMGESPSLVARLWRRRAERHHGGTSDPTVVVLPIRPALRLAAAGAGGERARPVVFRLGLLAPLDAEAELVGSEDGVELRVFGGDEEIIEVALGDGAVREAVAPKKWVLGTSWPEAVVRLRVVARRGAAFEAVLDFGEAREP